jgi:hypothetical protein
MAAIWFEIKNVPNLGCKLALSHCENELSQDIST